MSIAATRFAAGAARRDCVVAYAPRQTALAAAPLDDLVSYSLTPLSGALPEEGWSRLRGGGNCADAPRPERLVAVFPDYRSLPAAPGVKEWTLVAYDLDPAGRPVGVHVRAGTGDGDVTPLVATAA